MVVSGQKTREGDCTNLWCSQRRLEKCLKQRDSKSAYFIGYNRAKYKNIKNARNGQISTQITHIWQLDARLLTSEASDRVAGALIYYSF